MRPRLLAVVVLVSIVSSTAAADDLERVPPVTHPLTLKECGECHMAFQPALLPKESWERIMAGLKDHFGDDASLPADRSASIRAYLTSNAGDSGLPTITRITEQPWFARKHRYPPQVWQRPDITSKSNCLACHPRAERGIYDDD